MLPGAELKLLLVKLKRLLYSRGHSGDDTEDLIQEAFLRLEQYHRQHPVQHAEAFLVRTVLNLLADTRRHRRRFVVVADRPESLPLVDPGPPMDVVLDGQKRLRRFTQALLELSPRQREVFVMFRIEGYSFAQIAGRLGISVSMAEKHAARAMLSLANLMDAQESSQE